MFYNSVHWGWGVLHCPLKAAPGTPHIVHCLINTLSGLPNSILLFDSHTVLAINKKSGLVMEFFRKRSDPPPYFRKLWKPWGTFDFWSPKKEKQNFPKTPKMAIFKKKKNFLWKVPKSVHNPLFYNNVPQSYGLGQDPPPLRKNSITNPLFYGFPYSSSHTVIQWYNHRLHFQYQTVTVYTIILFDHRIGRLEPCRTCWTLLCQVDKQSMQIHPNRTPIKRGFRQVQTF